MKEQAAIAHELFRDNKGSAHELLTHRPSNGLYALGGEVSVLLQLLTNNGPNALKRGYKAYPYYQVPPCRLLTYLILRIEANLVGGISSLEHGAPLFYQEMR